jgi:hypothetical protein
MGISRCTLAQRLKNSPSTFSLWRILALSALPRICSSGVMEPRLTFEVWKEKLRADCVRLHKLPIFADFGDYVLALLWKTGIEPSVRAIIADGNASSENSQASSGTAA